MDSSAASTLGRDVTSMDTATMVGSGWPEDWAAALMAVVEEAREKRAAMAMPEAPAPA